MFTGRKIFKPFLFQPLHWPSANSGLRLWPTLAWGIWVPPNPGWYADSFCIFWFSLLDSKLSLFAIAISSTSLYSYIHPPSTKQQSQRGNSLTSNSVFAKYLLACNGTKTVLGLWWTGVWLNFRTNQTLHFFQHRKR